MEHLSNDHKDNPNQQENTHKPYNEMGYPVLSLLESQWKLRQQQDQNFPMEAKPLKKKILASEEINPKEQNCESHSQGSE